jgi:hypothetical protein
VTECGNPHVLWFDVDGRECDGDGAISRGQDVSHLVQDWHYCRRPASHSLDDPFDCHRDNQCDLGLHREVGWPEHPATICRFEVPE